MVKSFMKFRVKGLAGDSMHLSLTSFLFSVGCLPEKKNNYCLSHRSFDGDDDKNDLTNR